MKSDNPSIAQERSSVNLSRANASRIVRRDRTLTIGARVLYAELDDLAGFAGKTDLVACRIISRSLHVSPHSILDWSKELQPKYIRRQRRSHGIIYRLCWLDQVQAGGVL